jgi:hypothetical protein
MTGKIPRSLLRGESLEKVDLRINGSLWVGQLGEQSCRLRELYRNIRGGIILIEITEDRYGGRNSRIYFYPKSSYIPTLVIGGPTEVAKAARFDGTPMYRLKSGKRLEICPETSIDYPKDLKDLPGLIGVMQSHQYLFYTVRPSSFLLETVHHVSVDGSAVNVQVYANQFSPNKEFFAMIRPMEGRICFPQFPYPGIVVSNSGQYVANHPGWQFSQYQL